MKKFFAKALLFITVFIVTLLVSSRIMNKGNNNLTMEMGPATLPIVTLQKGDISYNELHGYLADMDVTYQRESITELGENRELDFTVTDMGEEIAEIAIEVRSCDGKRLIEHTPVTDMRREQGMLTVHATVKDLIEKNTEYALTIFIKEVGGREIKYHTRMIWADDMYAYEKLQFVKDFHEKTFDKEAAKELTKYLETNSKGDNTTLHKVDIHCSLSQVTWGELEVQEIGEPSITLGDLASQTASFTIRSMVAGGEEKDKTYYFVEEFYRIRYTTDRTYLLDFERTMTQIPTLDSRMFANDKIMLGITGEDIPMVESEDGSIVVFSVAGKLCSYNVSTNKLAVLFSFHDEENMSSQDVYNEHDIKILNVDEGGNIEFAVYGYMNRGRHEGEVGIQLYRYDSGKNTVEEDVYIPYDKPFSILRSDLEKLLFLDKDKHLYLYLDHTIYEVDVNEKLGSMLEVVQDDAAIVISASHEIIVWNEENQLRLMNFKSGEKLTTTAGIGEQIRPLGFMGEDVIYGIAREADIRIDEVGSTFFPMYKVCIENTSGQLLKEYQQENIYTLDLEIEENQITLSRVVRDEDGDYKETTPEHIMNNMEQKTTKNKIVVAAVDVYEKIVQLQVKNDVDAKTIKILTPKEVVFEGARSTILEKAEKQPLYYVYRAGDIEDIYLSARDAVKHAYEVSGSVMNESGRTVWIKGNRVTRNQIMAIKEPEKVEKEASLSVCLNTILKFKGISLDTEMLLAQGKSVPEILSEALPEMDVVELIGCPMDAMLYFVNRDIPVLAMLNNGEAVLITGFNEFNVVIFEPATGKLYKKGMNDSTEWFEENGNQFITYFE